MDVHQLVKRWGGIALRVDFCYSLADLNSQPPGYLMRQTSAGGGRGDSDKSPGEQSYKAERVRRQLKTLFQHN